MKKRPPELLILLLQFLLFYGYPYFSASAGPMGMMLIILIVTFLLSLLTGLFGRSRLKFLYPAAAALLFIPSVFIHYNESALVHSLWYLVVSSVGLSAGLIMKKLSGK